MQRENLQSAKKQRLEHLKKQQQLDCQQTSVQEQEPQ